MDYLVISTAQQIFDIHSSTREEGVLHIDNAVWRAASRALNGVAFKLYLYLDAQKDGACCALAAAEVSLHLGVSQASYYGALKELAAAGYLVHISGREYRFNFDGPTAEARSDCIGI